MIQKLRMPEATDGILKIDRRVADKMFIDLFCILGVDPLCPGSFESIHSRLIRRRRIAWGTE